MVKEDLEKKTKSAMFKCVRSAMQVTSKHARFVLDRISSIFSRLNCMNVNIVERGRHYSRPLSEREKTLVVQEIERTMVSKFKTADGISRSSSYDSLAEETLSVRDSTLSSPATPIATESVSTGSSTASVVSFLSFESSSVSPMSSGESSFTTTPSSAMYVTPNQPSNVTPMTSYACGSVGSSPKAPTACKSPFAVPVKVNSDESSAMSSMSVSPVSYYMSSTDLSVEDIDDIDDGFWEMAPNQN